MNFNYNIIRSSYVFKGSAPSIMQILLTPIYYHNKKEDSFMSGYKANLKSFSKGSIRNEYDFYKEDYGVNFQVQVKLKNFNSFYLGIIRS
jgi:hypothetical protein